MSLFQTDAVGSSSPLRPSAWYRSATLLRYALPVLAVTVTGGVIFLLEISKPERPKLFLFFGAIVMVAWYALDLQATNDKLVAERQDRERAEAALRETQNELVRAARITTAAELMASIAHEVNQPLAAVVANGQAALNWLQHSPPALEQTRDSIAAVVVAGERAAQVVGRIRHLMSKSAPILGSVDVNEVVADVITLMRAALTKRDIVVRCHLDPALPLILGDRIQLQQLIMNLFNNASDAMADVTDRIRELTVLTRTSEAGHVTVTVADSGRGFSAADATKLFQPFYTTKQDGMGMGLTICATIVASHGGRIQTSPRSPCGAIFQVDLPIRRVP
jgi:C4-dicarboxylate-specific signal transduction histidine kinase